MTQPATPPPRCACQEMPRPRARSAPSRPEQQHQRVGGGHVAEDVDRRVGAQRAQRDDHAAHRARRADRVRLGESADARPPNQPHATYKASRRSWSQSSASETSEPTARSVDSRRGARGLRVRAGTRAGGRGAAFVGSRPTRPSHEPTARRRGHRDEDDDEQRPVPLRDRVATRSTARAKFVGHLVAEVAALAHEAGLGRKQGAEDAAAAGRRLVSREDVAAADRSQERLGRGWRWIWNRRRGRGSGWRRSERVAT